MLIIGADVGYDTTCGCSLYVDKMEYGNIQQLFQHLLDFIGPVLTERSSKLCTNPVEKGAFSHFIMQ